MVEAVQLRVFEEAMREDAVCGRHALAKSSLRVAPPRRWRRLFVIVLQHVQPQLVEDEPQVVRRLSDPARLAVVLRGVLAAWDGSQNGCLDLRHGQDAVLETYFEKALEQRRHCRHHRRRSSVLIFDQTATRDIQLL
eukprot:7098285-Pyramimonas_sp.AAC.1